MEVNPEQIKQYVGMFAEQLGSHIAGQISSQMAGFMKSADGSGAGAVVGGGSGLGGGPRKVKVLRIKPDLYPTDEDLALEDYLEQETTVPQLLAEIADYGRFICETMVPDDNDDDTDREPEDKPRTRSSPSSNNHSNPGSKQKRKK